MVLSASPPLEDGLGWAALLGGGLGEPDRGRGSGIGVGGGRNGSGGCRSGGRETGGGAGSSRRRSRLSVWSTGARSLLRSWRTPPRLGPLRVPPRLGPLPRLNRSSQPKSPASHPVAAGQYTERNRKVEAPSVRWADAAIPGSWSPRSTSGPSCAPGGRLRAPAPSRRHRGPDRSPVYPRPSSPPCLPPALAPPQGPVFRIPQNAHRTAT
jgi:hypothetical protein